MDYVRKVLGETVSARFDRAEEAAGRLRPVGERYAEVLRSAEAALAPTA